MSHANLPPTGSPPLHSNNSSAFRTVNSPTPITLPPNANLSSLPFNVASAASSIAQSGANSPSLSAQARLLNTNAVPYAAPSPQTAMRTSQMLTQLAGLQSSGSGIRHHSAATPSHQQLQQQQAQAPSRHSPVIVNASSGYSTTGIGTPQRHHAHSMSERALATMPIGLSNAQQLASHSASVIVPRKSPAPSKTKPSIGVPTPSPPQSERSSPVQMKDANSGVPAHSLTYTLPTLVPPPQFGTVEPLIYRCARFGETHGPFLATLQLRTLVYLSPPDQHPLSSTVKNWCLENGVDIYNIGSQVFNDTNTSASDFLSSSVCLSLYSDVIKLTLDHVLLAVHSPCLIMCHNGLDLCSMVIGCLRRLQGLSYTSLLEEFTRYHTAAILRDELLSTSSSNRNRSKNHAIGGVLSSASLRYTSLNDARTGGGSDEARYRVEELIEIFDLELVSIPELYLERRKPSSKVNLADATNASAIVAPATTVAPCPSSTPSNLCLPSSACVEWFRAWKLEEKREVKRQRRERRRKRTEKDSNEGKQPSMTETIPLPPAELDGKPAVSIPPSTWPADLSAIYSSSQLVSSAVRYDKKAVLVDDDED